MNTDDDSEACVRDYMRVQTESDGTSLQVRIIDWLDPGTPVTRWELARRWPGVPSDSEIEAVKMELLDDRRYFQTCIMCKHRTPRGHMSDRKICQGCATEHFGVVY